MPTIFYVSYIVLWVLLILQGILLMLIYRHFGLMALSTAEGVQRDGLSVGVLAPTIRGAAVDGTITEWQPSAGHSHLLVFAAPDCGPCTKILPTLTQLAAASDRVRVNFIVPGFTGGGATTR